eukprot:TRINITY_DN7462_c0_g1_i2.p1 TRINITY_DN7462_c0_g1~~TRINITY_DN7462_c0_g1_i2.p1  ORF type:complete len:293 (-),score=56.00 TRINITY_DN7462_c0_g1_i2:25-903(-)
MLRLMTSDVKYIPVSTTTRFDHQLLEQDSEVYLLDYIGPDTFALDVAKRVKKVTILDHHKTAFELVDKWKASQSLPENMDVHLKMERSGATMAWDYFSQEAELTSKWASKEKLEKMYAYIEDTDLFARKLPHAREFSTGMASKEIVWNCQWNPSLFQQLQQLDLDTLIDVGTKELAKIDEIIKHDVANSFPIQLGGMEHDLGKCLAVETKYGNLRSEMGHELATKSLAEGFRGMGAIVYSDDLVKDVTKWKISMRGLAGEDTTTISQKYGGGGHAGASSFLLDKEIFKTWRL